MELKTKIVLTDEEYNAVLIVEDIILNLLSMSEDGRGPIEEEVLDRLYDDYSTLEEHIEGDILNETRTN